MTPLARWVLLALLLAGAAGSPGDDACVRLCRARTIIPDVAGTCDHERTRHIQSNGGRFESLVYYCLTPCARGSPLLGLACRSFRASLIQSEPCACDELRHDTLEDEPSDTEAVSVDLQKLDNDEKLVNWVRKIMTGRAMPGCVHGQSLQSVEDDGEDAVAALLGVFDDDAPDQAADTEPPVDWDVWCMNQCDNGQGGSACNCDIIP